MICATKHIFWFLLSFSFLQSQGLTFVHELSFRTVHAGCLLQVRVRQMTLFHLCFHDNPVLEQLSQKCSGV